MIQINNLTKRYGQSEKLAVDNLTLTVNPGEIFGFLGPNGAGKSTTIKCVTGILPYSFGSINVNGVNIADNPVAAKMNIGYVPDNHSTYEKLKGIEYLNFLANIYNVDKDVRGERIDGLVKLLNMEEAIGSQIRTYSHGMKQKICVIGSLIHDPKVWILDEPLTGLDPRSAFNLKELMRKRADEGKTVFFSSHILEVVERLCDRIGIISGGRLAAVGTVDDLKQNSSLEQFFLAITENNSQGGSDVPGGGGIQSGGFDTFSAQGGHNADGGRR